MTMQPHGSNQVALPEGFDDGLGDFDESDAAVPRLTIVHKEAMFKESLSGTKYQALDLIILGLVKQRTLWSTDVDDGEKPMCKSPDFEHGYPTIDPKLSSDKQFPWDKTPFSAPIAANDALVVVDCMACPLKEWKSHPNGKTPWCSEEFTLPVLYDSSGDGTFMPALLTIKKSGLKNLKAFLASFQRQKMPAFSVITRVTLKQESRGQTDYCVPEWQAGERTEGADWEGFSSTYKGLREFLHAPPARYDSDGNRIDSGDTSAPAAPVAQPVSTPAPQPVSTKPVNTAPVQSAPVTEAATPDDVHEAVIVPEPAPQPKTAETEDELPF